MSTKAALVTQIDGKFHVLASYYRRTDGDPLAAVRDTLTVIREQIDERGFPHRQDQRRHHGQRALPHRRLHRR